MVICAVDFNHKCVSEDIEHLEKVRGGNYLIAIIVGIPRRLNLPHAQRAEGNECGGENEFHGDSVLVFILPGSVFGIGYSLRGLLWQ